VLTHAVQNNVVVRPGREACGPTTAQPATVTHNLSIDGISASNHGRPKWVPARQESAVGFAVKSIVRLCSLPAVRCAHRCAAAAAQPSFKGNSAVRRAWWEAGAISGKGTGPGVPDSCGRINFARFA
jgi:hypothetical protein